MPVSTERNVNNTNAVDEWLSAFRPVRARIIHELNKEAPQLNSAADDSGVAGRHTFTTERDQS
ncbi:hypothetical protein JAO29_03070 [Edaphobacter sp. HDX4]|uniref:hypothetical protein n=1 Tax=Edaphobacter sp. HDX4 TaxID=2794064 RepID=UPI002FE635B2